MHAVDWTLFFGFLGWIVWDGLRRAKKDHTTDDYFLAGRSVPWWAVGLSVMATQASAITMVGTTGKGWEEGLRFVQFYFALPIAMVILAFTAVPLYHRLKVSTAYEYLGVRFDRKTRLLAALVFMVLRCLSVGFVIYAPSLVLAKVLDLPLSAMILTMGGIAVIYTSIGGLGAVIRTDVKQMAMMIVGLILAAACLVAKMPDGVGLDGAIRLAGETGRLQAVDLSWDPAEKYTLWSSLLGGLFSLPRLFRRGPEPGATPSRRTIDHRHPARALPECGGEDPVSVPRARHRCDALRVLRIVGHARDVRAGDERD